MNNNIEENYCSFEISKLLKEKGYDMFCSLAYDKYGNEIKWRHGTELMRNSENYYKVDKVCVAATHALAIEWIR